MKKIALAFATAALCLAADAPKTYTGTVTDDMCAGNHAAMGGKDPVKCASECVRDMGAKYAILVTADVAHPVYYVLSDQLSGAKYSGKKVVVTGKVDSKNILQVASIAPAGSK